MTDFLDHINTIATHGGDEHNPTSAVTSPIYQTATWSFDDPAEAAVAAATAQPAQFYNRYGSPNTRQAEAALAQLCGGEAAIVSASGMSAVSMTLIGLLRAGDHVVAQQTLYPATRTVCTELLPRFGVDVTLVDQTDVAAFAQALRPETRLIYTETPANPILALTDLAAVAALARSRGLLTVCDNTFATPYNQRPLALGIDLELHSATKYLAGHSDVGAGVVVGSADLIGRLFKQHVLLGATLHPQEAWLLQRGLKTFGLRMAQHNHNGLAIARRLIDHPAVVRVHYPGLPEHPQHALAQRQMPGGSSGMVCFELRGGRSAGYMLLKRLRLITVAVSLGGVHSLATHAASTIGALLSDAQLAEAGIAPGLVRLSAGIEDTADLIADLDQALEGL